MSDYFKASLADAPRAPLTPNSKAGDAAAVVEIVSLIADPTACKKRLDELQTAAAHADLRLAAATAKEAELAKQVEAMAARRTEFHRELEEDRKNHVAETDAQKRAWRAHIEEFQQRMADIRTSRSQPEVPTDAV